VAPRWHPNRFNHYGMEAHHRRVLMRLAVASGHAGRLTSPTVSIGWHCAANSLPDHHPMSVNRHQLTSTVPSTPRMASVRGPFDHSVRSDGMKDKNGARRSHICRSGQQDPSATPLPPRSTGAAGPTRRGGCHTPRSLISLSFFPLPFSRSLVSYSLLLVYKREGRAPFRGEIDRTIDRAVEAPSNQTTETWELLPVSPVCNSLLQTQY